ncbi:MAG TPA: DUF262 domain-containing protein [Pirellulaceae bacterium]|jgi:GNAT superfamily N-acetyltransferase|nr:DUF262 domain-containing protein [Pirellulaceae bacterium]
MLQWQPLWNDVARMAERLLQQPNAKHYPHFLGAVVLQQVQNPAGTMQERTIIDGQQRLTTLQLLFDAMHAELAAVGAAHPAQRLETLVANPDAYRRKAEDRYKVWPTNRDRPAFNAVMAAEPPVDHDAIGFRGERMVEAHRFFCSQAREWLRSDGEENVARRAEAIETVAQNLLQMVVIDLGADENAQEIFETLNARGAQLTAADLIKNFVFQRLLESGADVEREYDQHWKEFESAFWEAEVGAGRIRYPRSSIFLNHWLAARTGEEVLAREVFTRFKRYAMDSRTPMPALLRELAQASQVYRRFIEGGNKLSGPIDRVELFAYRTGVMESEVIKPLLLYLYDPQLPPISTSQLEKSLRVIESWMVRRMIVRATTKSYTQFVAEIITHLGRTGRETAGDALEAFFKGQASTSRYWPDDEEIIDELRVLPIYRRLGRGRLRMLLEAIEDWLRGWTGDRESVGAERVTRGKFAIEHVMPRKWQSHWPLPDSPRAESEREALLHTLGNLTLLTGKLNSKVSNGPWIGESGKQKGLQAHDALFLNRGLIEAAAEGWTESAIRNRSDELARAITRIWPAPEGHRSGFRQEKVVPRHRVDLSDLLSAGCIAPGTPLYPRSKKHATVSAAVLSDGRIDVAGAVYASPSDAAKAILGSNMNGWWFFLVDKSPRRSLKDVRLAYLESMAVDADDEDADDDLDDES